VHDNVQTLDFISGAAMAGTNSMLVPPSSTLVRSTCAVIVQAYDFAVISRIPEDFYRHDQIAARSELPNVICNSQVCVMTLIAYHTSSKPYFLAKHHSSIVGVKLTCGSVAKITRLAAALPLERFVFFGGQANFIFGGLISGSSGCIRFSQTLPRDASFASTIFITDASTSRLLHFIKALHLQSKP
jgi:4-hydroxy-2-oxoglutarate aldolase